MVIDEYNSAYERQKLAEKYRDGIGVEQNPEKAIKYFEMNKSYRTIGIMYRDGKGIEKNFEKAIEYFKKEAAMGRKTGIRSLKSMLRKKQCTEKDLEDALEKFEEGRIKRLEEIINRPINEDFEDEELNKYFEDEKLYNRGIAYYELKKYKQAIKDFDRVIELFKEYNPQLEEDIAIVYHKRGLCYQALGENENAEKDFSKARKLGYNG